MRNYNVSSCPMRTYTKFKFFLNYKFVVNEKIHARLYFKI